MEQKKKPLESRLKIPRAYYLGRGDKAKTVDIAAVIGLGPNRTRVILTSMDKRNMIVAEGANRNRIYRLPQTIN